MKKGTYKHFKGDFVKVIGIAKHSETMEDMVIYEHGEVWVRPLSMFTEEVINPEGNKVPRFTFVSED
jgi:hypothetical protein